MSKGWRTHGTSGGSTPTFGLRLLCTTNTANFVRCASRSASGSVASSRSTSCCNSAIAYLRAQPEKWDQEGSRERTAASFACRQSHPTAGVRLYACSRERAPRTTMSTLRPRSFLPASSPLHVHEPTGLHVCVWGDPQPLCADDLRADLLRGRAREGLVEGEADRVDGDVALRLDVLQERALRRQSMCKGIA
jgi:hypothetical protein